MSKKKNNIARYIVLTLLSPALLVIGIFALCEDFLTQFMTDKPYRY